VARRRRRSTRKDREFVSEAEEILERMRDDLAGVSDRLADGGEVDPDGVNRLFRSAHSLKALAGLFEFDPIRYLAHQLENILDALRLGRVPFDSGAFDLIEAAVNVFAALLERVGSPEDLETVRDTIAELSARIESASPGGGASPDELGSLGLDPALVRALTEYEEHRLRENLRCGHSLFVVEAGFPLMSFEQGLTDLTESIRSIGEVISTLPAPGDSPEAQIRFSLLFASSEPMGQVAALVESVGGELRVLTPEPATLVPPAVADPDPDADLAAVAPVQHAGELVVTTSLKSISDTVRVDVGKLDELMNLVGELVIERGTFGDLIEVLRAEPATARIAGEFAKAHQSLERKLKELQGAVLDVRMVPLSQIFDKVSRVVRSLKRSLNRDVRLEMRGSDTELDKLIAEDLVDPLMHVVRNALDHGIEPPEDRRAAGKEPHGLIEVEAYQRGNHVVIQVRDDGSGVDVVALRRRAEAIGLIDSGAELGAQEVLDLMFAPGISTRSQVTDTSGRGVGMDVVRTNVNALGGVVDVRSLPGQGTTLSMTVPITLAIIQSLLVGVGDQRFAVPLNAVLETLLVDPSEIQRSQSREFLNLRGEALPLRRLASEFGIPVGDDDTKPFVVVVGVGDHRVGLLVDRLDGQQDTLIKPIQGPVQSIWGIAGATEVGNRNPVLVIDVAALVEDAGHGLEAA
jgi:two-component system chemotaxis sensor kinase CheA